MGALWLMYMPSEITPTRKRTSRSKMKMTSTAVLNAIHASSSTSRGDMQICTGSRVATYSTWAAQTRDTVGTPPRKLE